MQSEFFIANDINSKNDFGLLAAMRSIEQCAHVFRVAR